MLSLPPMTTQSCLSMFVHSPVPVHSSVFSYKPFPYFWWTSFVRTAYKKMPCICKYIQSFTCVWSVKSSIESGYVYQRKGLYFVLPVSSVSLSVLLRRPQPDEPALAVALVLHEVDQAAPIRFERNVSGKIGVDLIYLHLCCNVSTKKMDF
jgi:hypothetical protein